MAIAPPRTRARGSRSPARRILLLFLAGAMLLGTRLEALEYESGPFSCSLSGTIEASGSLAFMKDSNKEIPSTFLLLKPQADLGEHLSFYAEIKGGYEGSQRSPANEGIFIRLDRVYPSKNRYLEVPEAYVNLYVSVLDLRVGIQKFAWGTLDQLNPTDNLNPWDLRHPFTTDPLKRKIGIPAVRALVGSAFSSVLVEAIWVPFYVPFRMGDPGDRWYPPLFEAVRSYQVPDLGLPFPLPPLRIVQTNEEPELPARTISNSDFGIRISRTLGNVDVSASYFNGFDRQPVFSATGRILATLEFRPSRLDLTYDLLLRPQLHRMQAFGLDLAASWGSFTLRAEGAYIKNRYLNTGLAAIPEIARDFQFPDLSEFDLVLRPGGLTVSFPFSPKIAFPKNLLSIGAGGDYQIGNHLLTLQVVGNSILNYHGEPLIYDEFELNIILGVNSRFLRDTLAVEGGLFINPMEQFWMLNTEVTYSITDSATVGANLLLLDGDKSTPLGQYSRNDEITFFTRYSF